MLKPLGNMTGQFGKNHLGDLNAFLPTVYGFDEFYVPEMAFEAKLGPHRSWTKLCADFLKKRKLNLLIGRSRSSNSRRIGAQTP